MDHGKADWDVSGGLLRATPLADQLNELVESAVPAAIVDSVSASSQQISPEHVKTFIKESKVEVDGLIEKKRIHSTVLRMALLRLAMKGVTAKQAAETLGCSWDTAKLHYKDPLFRRAVFEKLKEAFGDIDEAFSTTSRTLHELIQEQALKSFQDLVGMLGRNDLGHAHRIKINQDFLNRCEESQQMTKHTTQLDPAALMRASQVAKEMEAAASGKLIPIQTRVGEKTGT